MNSIIEQISRQDPDFLRHIYRIRQSVFEKELCFPRQDRMVYNEWDSLSNHYLLIHDGKPSGTISVIDLTDLTEILNTQNLPLNLRIAKMTKLAILPEARGVANLKKLVFAALAELKDFDYVTADVAPPSSNPADMSRYQKGEYYKKLFGLEKIATINESGIIRRILGRKLL